MSVYTTSNGAPILNPEASQRVGHNGPLLLQDFHLLDLLAHFDRERIPERVVHAKGSGAYGEFEVTHDITDICDADLFSEVGKKTNLVARFSTVGGEKGFADSARDPRGFSVKMYTEEGNYDWVFNNTPIFFIRDPALFPVFIHTQKRNPQTNLKDATMFWDYLSTHQESIHQVMYLFSDRGTPRDFRHMNGYSGHTYKFIKKNGAYKYVQIHVKTDQGIENLTNDEAAEVAKNDPDASTRDLFEAISKGDFPSWTVYVQVLDPADVDKFRWNIFDLTKIWPHEEIPLREVGRMTLNKNVDNYFAEIEQLAFSPGHVIPGIEPSADPVLQSRIFSYPDTQRHRLGVNYQQIPVNQPLHANNPYQRDGTMTVRGNSGSKPAYPSTFDPVEFTGAWTPIKETWSGKVVTERLEVTGEDYVQATALWEVLARTPGQQDNLVYNVASHLKGAHEVVRKRTYGMFGKVDSELGKRIEAATEEAVLGGK